MQNSQYHTMVHYRSLSIVDINLGNVGQQTARVKEQQKETDRNQDSQTLLC